MNGDRFPRGLARTLLAPAVLSVLFAAGLLYAYYSTFTQFRPYDDEGTMLLRVSMLVNNPGSYDSLSGVYGPFYYLHKYALHSWLNLPVSHDVNRLTSIVLWGLVAAGCALFVHRLTRSIVLAAIVQMQLLLHLRTFINEPGHPHEIALVVLAAALVFSSLIPGRRGRWIGLFGLGAATGALLLVKVNLGAYLVAPVASALLFSLPRNALSTGLRWLTAAVWMVMPAVVLWRHIHLPWGRNYAALVTLLVAACLVASARRPRGEELSWQEVGAVVGAAVLTVCGICGIVLSWGNAPLAIANSVFWRAASFSSTFVIPAPVGDDLVTASIVSFLLAVCWAVTAPGLRERTVPRLALACVKITYGCYAFYWLQVLGPGLLGQSLVLPFVWLVLAGADQDRSPRQLLPRVLLGLLAAFQILQAYPVHGSQATWAVFLVAPVSAVCIGDAFRTFAELAEPRWIRNLRHADWQQGVVSLLLLLLACGWYYAKADIPGAREAYLRRTPLALPGANRMRLEAADVSQLRWLAENVRANCDGFVGMPGFGSLYIWTELAPPASMNGAWMLNLEGEYQQAIVEKMRTYRRPCVVQNPAMVGFWLGGKPLSSDMPLVRYIREEFEPGPRFGAYTILVGREGSGAAGGKAKGDGSRVASPPSQARNGSARSRGGAEDRPDALPGRPTKATVPIGR